MIPIPATPLNSGQNIAGKVSWFGGPKDVETAGQKTASGASASEPGVAVYNRETLGGYWRITGANGKSAVLKQTDLGPAPWTGRKIDVTYSALGKLGYNEGNFPTDSTFKAEYLGKNAPKEPAHTASIPSIAGSGTVFDQAAFQKAQRASLLGKFIASNGGRAGNPLFASGLLTTTAPNPAEFTTAKSEATSPSLPRTSGSTKLGGFLSASAPLQMKRIDQGQDVLTKPGEALLAPGDGTVIAVKSDPSGFGPDYPVVKFTSGPLAGHTVYLGHTDSALRQGDEFKAGQSLARTSKTGHNAPPGWAEIGMASALGQGIHNQGAQIAPYLKR